MAVAVGKVRRRCQKQFGLNGTLTCKVIAGATIWQLAGVRHHHPKVKNGGPNTAKTTIKTPMEGADIVACCRPNQASGAEHLKQKWRHIMTQLRFVLIAMILIIAAFTAAAVADGGFDLITPFFAPILGLTWQGQFNVDFSFYLVLSGIWMAWRGGFSGGSIALGLLAPPLGMLFFAPYLIYLVAASGRNPRRLLLGVHATG
ncbi:MAG: hypothetical protein AB8B51_00960 [Sedimentitalea sp.]